MKPQSLNPRTKREIWFLIAVITLLVMFALAPWGTEQEAAASERLVPIPLADQSGQSDVRSVVVQAGSTLEPAEQSDPTSTPQPVVELHGEGRHSAGAMVGSTPLSLTGSYYEWGYAKTCRDSDFSTCPPTCIGETSTFYCDDEEIHNVAVLYDVTEGGYARTEIYMPDGSLYGYWETDWPAPDPGFYYSCLTYGCRGSIAGTAMVDYPGNWHTEFYVADYGAYLKGEWVLEQTLWWELICDGGECPGASTRTYVTTADNENNAGYGQADGDMGPDAPCIWRTDNHHPIEFNIHVDPLPPAFSWARLTLIAWDVDEEDPVCPEVDTVYFNGHFVGYLRGANDVFSTSGPYDINPAWVQQGNNLVQVYVNTTGCQKATGGERWCAGIRQGTLQLEGGEGAAWKEEPYISLVCRPPGGSLGVIVDVNTSLSSQEVMVEVNVIGPHPQNYVLVGDSQTKTIYGSDPGDAFVFDLTIPDYAPAGMYTVQIIVYDTCSGTIQEINEHDIPIDCGGEVTPTRTPTLTPWPTRTPTRTPTLTPWPTRTPTRTPTLTPWPTRTPTRTPTLTPWPTRTPTPTSTTTLPYWKSGGWTDYAPSGMPDFDQRQDQWDNPPGSGNWSYCGPLAVANCLWWFDSKMEPYPVPPPAINDTYPLVQSYSPGQWDDHNPMNLPYLVEDLAYRMDTDGQRTGGTWEGTYVDDMYNAILDYLDDHGLAGHYEVTMVEKPSFDWVAFEVKRCEDVILLLGFWTWGQEGWERLGGHFVTSAGVDPTNWLIAFSNPIKDSAESGWPGRVLDGTLIPHVPIPGHDSTVHNDAGNISHDIYYAVSTDSPGGTWGPASYAESYEAIKNFVGQNFPRDFPERYRPKRDLRDYAQAEIQTEVEYAIAISPAEATPTPTITPWPTRTPTATPTITPTPTTTPCQCWVHFPPYDKPYAQEEITIYPYPVQAGEPTKLCVTIMNDASVPRTVTLEFGLANFGIGLDFTTIPAAGNPRSVTVPAYSTGTYCIVWTPTLSDIGHRCIQVTISGQCCHDLKSQKNLDVREPLVPGQTDTLTIPVQNPLQEVVDVEIRIENDCSNWNVYADPAYLPSMGWGEVRDVVLHVTPSQYATLGSGCCIDVEAWAIRGYPHYDEVLIGGIRKCDEGNFIPPDEPHWAEREIEVRPYPLEVGRRTEVCATLDNWGDWPETVTLEFLMAQFSIGRPFERIAHPDNPQTVTIPPHSTKKVCISFVPTHAGHYCFQIRITKLGYEPVISMLNLDVIEPLWPGDTDTVQFPVCNPLDHTATVELELDNDCPGWNVQVTPSQMVLGSGECTTASLSVTPQQGVTLGTECTVDVIGWADNQFIGGTRKIDRPPIPHPNHRPLYDEEEIEIYPFPPEVGVLTEICAVLNNKAARSQDVEVGFYVADFNMGAPFQLISVPGNPRTVTIPAESTAKACIEYTPLTPGHKCYEIRISQEGYETIISRKNLDVGEHLRPGQEDQLEITVGNPTSAAADIQIAVSSGCPGWEAWPEPEILYNVPPGGTRTVTLRVVPPAGETTLGTGCYIDVESYINGELISGIRKVDVPPVHPPPDEPFYAQRELTIKPNPPVAGQPAEICAVLHNYANSTQTADVTLYYADFGAGTPFQEVARLEDVVFPANSTVTKCVNWTPPPGAGHVCLQVKIEQDGYEDIVSQMNVDTVELPGTVHLPMEYEFTVGNPGGQTKKVQLDVKEIGLPAGWTAELEHNEVTLGPGATAGNTLRIQSPSHAFTVMEVNEDVLPGDAHIVAVEAFIDDELIGGVQFEFEAEKREIYLPLIMKGYD